MIENYYKILNHFFNFFCKFGNVYLDDVQKQIPESSLLSSSSPSSSSSSFSSSSSTYLPRYTRQLGSSHNKGIFLLSSFYDLARFQHTRNQWICTSWFVDLFYLVPFIRGDGVNFSPVFNPFTYIECLSVLGGLLKIQWKI